MRVTSLISAAMVGKSMCDIKDHSVLHKRSADCNGSIVPDTPNLPRVTGEGNVGWVMELGWARI